MESQDQMPSKEKDRWDKISISVDICHKIIILIIGTAIAGIFYWFQQQQMESRYFADLMAQRENTESQLRAEMFKTLFDAYFANKLQAKTPLNGESSSELDRLKQETMFIDLLSRNFENIDVRPLFEDLDGQLTALLESTDKPDPVKSAAITDLRRETFTSRENIRRVAIGASSRQITTLVGTAHADVKTFQAKQCGDEQPRLISPFPFKGVHTIIDQLKDGVVTMRLVPDGQKEPIYLRVTFYDMPSLENIVLPSRERIAFTLSRYLSHDSCKDFKEQLDVILKTDCEGNLSEKQACDSAWIRVVTFPNSYIGVRDRPYLNDLLAGNFQKTSRK